MNNLNIGVKVKTNDTNRDAEIIDVTRGWFTVQFKNGDKTKVRGGNLTVMDGTNFQTQDPAPTAGLDSSASLDAEDHMVDDVERDMNSQLKKAKEKYVKTTNYAGERSVDCGDSIAELLRGLEPEEVCGLADEVCNEPRGYHQERYVALNAGQQRMNSGNRIRGALKKGKVSENDVRELYNGLGLQPAGQDVA